MEVEYRLPDQDSTEERQDEDAKTALTNTADQLTNLRLPLLSAVSDHFFSDQGNNLIPA